MDGSGADKESWHTAETEVKERDLITQTLGAIIPSACVNSAKMLDDDTFGAKVCVFLSNPEAALSLV